MRGGSFLGLSAALLLVCCSAGRAPADLQTASAPSLTFGPQDQAKLRSVSCPNTEDFIPPQSVPLSVTPIALESLNGATLDGLTYAGGWHLESDEPNFGGLSGLSLYSDSQLLTVSDAGAFVWIDMLGNAPSGSGAISYMRSESGNALDGKNNADSEGLELVNGLALVSFERNHRVLAFDLANCGASALGALVANIPDSPEGLGRAIPENEGAEALVLSADNTLSAGLELKGDEGSPILDIVHGDAPLSGHLPRPSGMRLVGLDDLGGNLFALYRSYNPLFGNANQLHAHYLGNPEPTVLAHLKRPFPVDNFEGVAATQLADGTVRLYIISDDNFSERQRTLLMAFDVVPEGAS